MSDQSQSGQKEQRHRHPWGCAILSFIAGIVTLCAVLVVTYLVLANTSSNELVPLRQTRSAKQIAAAVTASIEEEADTKHADTKALVARMYQRQQEDPDCTMDFLVLSGGGEQGAFGAGFLVGWSTVAPGTNALPVFDGVTGVSAGSYIAPYAYLGTPEDLKTIDEFFRNPSPDWATTRGTYFFNPDNSSFASVDGLERSLDKAITLDFAKRIVESTTDGRLLLIQATNIEEGIPKVFDFVAAARTSITSNDPGKMQEILLASSAIPVVFPPREIDDSLYVDGSVSGNFYAGGRASEQQHTFGAIWKREHPDAPIPTTRYWIIMNGDLRPTPKTVQPRWTSIGERTIDMAMMITEIITLRQLYALADLTRLRGNGEVEVRWIAIPEEYTPPAGTGEYFDKTTMRGLSQEGRRLGADPGSWKTTSP